MRSNVLSAVLGRHVLSPFVIQLLFIMFFVQFVKGGLLITFLPVYMDSALHATKFVIGWTMAVQYIGDNALRTPIGWVIDRIGYRLTMLTGVVMTLLAVVIISMSTGMIWIIVACALLGAGTAPLWPCVITGATEMAGEKSSGTVMSVVYMAWLSGVGLGPFVTTYFMHGAFDSAFRLLTVMMVAVVAVAFFLPGRRHAERAREASRPAHERVGRKPQAASLTIGQRTRLYLAEVRQSLTVSPVLFPAMFAQTFALGLLTPVLTLYATKELLLTGSQFRLFLLAGGAVTVLFMIPVGRLVDRWGTTWFLHVGFALSSVVLVLFTHARSLQALFVLVGLLGVGYALLIPAWNALIAKAIPPDKRGAVWGFFLTIEGAGTTIGPICSGLLWDLINPHAPFVASGIVLGLLFFAHWFMTIDNYRRRAAV